VTLSVLLDIAANASRWQAPFRTALPEARFHLPGEIDAVDYVIAWRPCADTFRRTRVRKAIFNLGAGVDALLDVADLPADIPVYRLLDAGMASQMAEYAVATCCAFTATSTRMPASSAQWNGGRTSAATRRRSASACWVSACSAAP